MPLQEGVGYGPSGLGWSIIFDGALGSADQVRFCRIIDVAEALEGPSLTA